MGTYAINQRNNPRTLNIGRRSGLDISLAGSSRSGRLATRAGMGGQGTFDGADMRERLSQASGDQVEAVLEQIQAEVAELYAAIDMLAARGGGFFREGIGDPLFTTVTTVAGATTAVVITGWIPEDSLLISELVVAGDGPAAWHGLDDIAVGGAILANSQLVSPGVLDVSRFPAGGGYRVGVSGQNLTANALGAAGTAVNPVIVSSLYGPPVQATAGMRAN